MEGPPAREPPPAHWHYDRLLLDIANLIREHGCKACSSEALLMIGEVARREVIKVAWAAQREALMAGRRNVNEKDASKAFVELLDSFAPSSNYSSQLLEQSLARDINSMVPLGPFPSQPFGLPLPTEAVTSADWRFQDPPQRGAADEELNPS